jgi:hypothetical protein
MTKKILFGVLSLVLLIVHVKSASASSFIVVETNGSGLKREEALMDARRNAVQGAIGFVSKGMTVAADDKIVEGIVQLSRAFIEKYEIIDEQRQNGRYTVRVKSWIRRENLIEGLSWNDPDKSLFDGVSVFVRAATREQQINEAADMLDEIFSSIPVANYVHSTVAGDDFSVSSGKLNLEVNFTFDESLYFKTLVPQFEAILDYIAESKLKDVPMAFDMKSDSPIPPLSTSSLSEYVKLMEMEGGNRYIELPGSGGFANIYLMTKNYYFNCYRVPAGSFARLMERTLIPDRQDRLTGRIFQNAALRMTFKNKGGQKIREYVQPIQLTNAMVFAGVAGLKSSPYTKDREGQLDEQRHSFIIMPFIGIYSEKNSDYTLVRNDSAVLPVELSASEIKLVNQVDCQIEVQ